MGINYTVDRDYEYESITEKIIALNDRLSTDIIIENINLQYETPNVSFNRGNNYFTLFKDAYEEITPDDDYYDRGFLIEIIEEVSQGLINKLQEKFKINFTKEIGAYDTEELLSDVETIHEVLFMRQFQNIVDFIDVKLFENRDFYVDLYKKELESDEELMKNVFIQNATRKFKHFDDVVILHYIDDIIYDILEDEDNKSMYMFLEDVLKSDPEELYNYKFRQIMNRYGEIISFENDIDCFELYTDIKNLDFIKSEIRNKIMLRHLERSELVSE